MHQHPLSGYCMSFGNNEDKNFKEQMAERYQERLSMGYSIPGNPLASSRSEPHRHSSSPKVSVSEQHREDNRSTKYKAHLYPESNTPSAKVRHSTTLTYDGSGENQLTEAMDSKGKNLPPATLRKAHKPQSHSSAMKDLIERFEHRSHNTSCEEVIVDQTNAKENATTTITPCRLMARDAWTPSNPSVMLELDPGASTSSSMIDDSISLSSNCRLRSDFTHSPEGVGNLHRRLESSRPGRLRRKSILEQSFASSLDVPNSSVTSVEKKTYNENSSDCSRYFGDLSEKFTSRAEPDIARLATRHRNEVKHQLNKSSSKISTVSTRLSLRALNHRGSLTGDKRKANCDQTDGPGTRESRKKGVPLPDTPFSRVSLKRNDCRATSRPQAGSRLRSSSKESALDNSVYQQRDKHALHTNNEKQRIQSRSHQNNRQQQQQQQQEFKNEKNQMISNNAKTTSSYQAQNEIYPGKKEKISRKNVRAMEKYLMFLKRSTLASTPFNDFDIDNISACSLTKTSDVVNEIFSEFPSAVSSHLPNEEDRGSLSEYPFISTNQNITNNVRKMEAQEFKGIAGAAQKGGDQPLQEMEANRASPHLYHAYGNVAPIEGKHEPGIFSRPKSSPERPLHTPVTAHARKKSDNSISTGTTGNTRIAGNTRNTDSTGSNGTMITTVFDSCNQMLERKRTSAPSSAHNSMTSFSQSPQKTRNRAILPKRRSASLTYLQKLSASAAIKNDKLEAPSEASHSKHDSQHTFALASVDTSTTATVEKPFGRMTITEHDALPGKNGPPGEMAGTVLLTKDELADTDLVPVHLREKGGGFLGPRNRDRFYGAVLPPSSSSDDEGKEEEDSSYVTIANRLKHINETRLRRMMKPLDSLSPKMSNEAALSNDAAAGGCVEKLPTSSFPCRESRLASMSSLSERKGVAVSACPSSSAENIQSVSMAQETRRPKVKSRGQMKDGSLSGTRTGRRSKERDYSRHLDELNSAETKMVNNKLNSMMSRASSCDSRNSMSSSDQDYHMFLQARRPSVTTMSYTSNATSVQGVNDQILKLLGYPEGRSPSVSVPRSTQQTAPLTLPSHNKCSLLKAKKKTEKKSGTTKKKTKKKDSDKASVTSVKPVKKASPVILDRGRKPLTVRLRSKARQVSIQTPKEDVGLEPIEEKSETKQRSQASANPPRSPKSSLTDDTVVHWPNHSSEDRRTEETLAKLSPTMMLLPHYYMSNLTCEPTSFWPIKSRIPLLEPMIVRASRLDKIIKLRRMLDDLTNPIRPSKVPITSTFKQAMADAAREEYSLHRWTLSHSYPEDYTDLEEIQWGEKSEPSNSWVSQMKVIYLAVWVTMGFVAVLGRQLYVCGGDDYDYYCNGDDDVTCLASLIT